MLAYSSSINHLILSDLHGNFCSFSFLSENHWHWRRLVQCSSSYILYFPTHMLVLYKKGKMKKRKWRSELSFWLLSMCHVFPLLPSILPSQKLGDALRIIRFHCNIVGTGLLQTKGKLAVMESGHSFSWYSVIRVNLAPVFSCLHYIVDIYQA